MGSSETPDASIPSLHWLPPMSAATDTLADIPGAVANNCSSRERDVFSDSLLFRRHLAEREEILRHKWIESEKVGFDIGFERAWASWVLRHRGDWRRPWHRRRS